MSAMSLTKREKIAEIGIAQEQALARVETLRAQAGRYFLLAILRANCAPAKRAQYHELHQTPAGFVREGMEILLGHGNVDGVHPAALDWIRSRSQSNGALCDQGRALLKRLDALEQAIDDAPDQVIQLTLQVTAPLTAFMQLLEEDVIAPLRAESAAARERRAQESQTAAESARMAMVEISQISRSVRLISLNASVEAARVGDQGRGFAVIAGEIKALAESIDLVTQSATSSMTQLMGAVTTE